VWGVPLILIIKTAQRRNSMSTCPIDIHDVQEIGYHPVVDYGAWRVAVLNYIDELLPENIDNVQQHSETDEVFVLLSGQCILFTAEVEGESVHDIWACPMELGKIYNVPKGVYHTHTLTPGTAVLIVENVDTTDNNSPKVELSPTSRAEILRLSEGLFPPKGE
jgi:hypothetical protein